MGGVWLAYVCAGAGAAANAAASLLQRSAAAPTAADPATSLRVKLMAVLLRRPRYLAGVGVMAVAFLLQATALSRAPLSVVQPILALELLIVLAALRLQDRRAVTAHEWAGAAAAIAGVGGFIAVAAPAPSSAAPAALGWVVTAGLVWAAVAWLVLAARRGSAMRRAALLATAAAVLFALTAAFMRVMAETAGRSLPAVFTTWQTYAMAATGVLAAFLAANAFRAGPLTSSQPPLTVVDPLVSVAIGLVLFGDRLRSSGPAILFEVVFLAVMAGGLVVVGRAQAFAAERERRAAEARRLAA